MIQNLLLALSLVCATTNYVEAMENVLGAEKHARSVEEKTTKQVSADVKRILSDLGDAKKNLIRDAIKQGEYSKAVAPLKEVYESPAEEFNKIDKAYAAAFLGMFYLNGQGVQGDANKAYEYLMFAYDVGKKLFAELTPEQALKNEDAQHLIASYIRALNYLSRYYHSVKNDACKAFELLTEAYNFSKRYPPIIHIQHPKKLTIIKKNYTDPFAAANLGYMHEMGLCVNQDKEKALSYYQEVYETFSPVINLFKDDMSETFFEAYTQALNRMIVLSMDNLETAGKYATELYDITKKTSQYNPFVISQHISAAFYLGAISAQKKDYANAERYYNEAYNLIKAKASHAGLVSIDKSGLAFNLGLLYYFGFNQKIDNKKAWNYFFEAYKESSQDSAAHHMAAAHLGEMSLGVIVYDPKKARKFFKEIGDGVYGNEIKEYNELTQNFTLSDEDQNRKLLAELIALHAKTKGHDFFTGQAITAYCLGQLYLYGKGIDRNEKLALEYFTESFMLGKKYLRSQPWAFDAGAMIAHMYVQGLGVPKNLSRAKKFLDEVQILIRKYNGPIDEKIVRKKFDEVKAAFMLIKESGLSKKSQKEIGEAGEASLAEQRRLEEIEQTKHKRKQLVFALKESLDSGDVEQSEKLLRDIEKTDHADAELVALQEQFKKLKSAEVRARFEKALEIYKQRPSSARLQEAKNRLEELQALKIDQFKEYLRSAYQEIRDIEKGLRISPTEITRISPFEEEKKEAVAQEQYIILDPYQVLQQVPGDHQKSVNDALEQMRYQYENTAAKKLGSYEGLWRVRVGNYRIVYVVLPQQQAIGLIAIGPRASVYEDLGTYSNHEEFFVALNTYDPEELLVGAERELKVDAAKAVALLELYRWKVKGEPYDVMSYLKSLLYLGTAYNKLHELQKARTILQDLIDQAVGNHLLQQQARVGLAQVEQKAGNLVMAREILEEALRASKTQKERKEIESRLEKLRPLSPPQDDKIERLRKKWHRAQAVLKDSPTEAEQQIREFLHEADYKELSAERQAATELLNQLAWQETFEALLQNGLDELEAGNFIEAQEHLQAYLQVMGSHISAQKRKLITEKLAEIALGQAVERKSLEQEKK